MMSEMKTGGNNDINNAEKPEWKSGFVTPTTHLFGVLRRHACNTAPHFVLQAPTDVHVKKQNTIADGTRKKNKKVQLRP